MRVILLFLCSMLLTTTTGCWNMREIEDRNQVLAMGIDRDKDKYEVTVEVPIPSNVSGSSETGGGGGGGDPVAHYSMKGQSLYRILSRMQTRMNKLLFLGHMGVVVFGEDESKEDISGSLDLLVRTFDVSRKVLVLCTKGKAKDLLTKESGVEGINTSFIADMVRNNVNEQVLMNTNLTTLISDIFTPSRRAPVINEIKATANGYTWDGLAIFHGHKKVGNLSDTQSIPLLHIRGERIGHPITVSCRSKKGIIEFRPLDIKRTIDVEKNQKLHVLIELEGELVEKTCPVDISDQKVARQINQQIKHKYEQLANQVLQQAKQKWKTDIFELGHYVHAFYPSFYRRYDWQNGIASVPIEIEYHIQVRRMGMEA